MHFHGFSIASRGMDDRIRTSEELQAPGIWIDRL